MRHFTVEGNYNKRGQNVRATASRTTQSSIQYPQPSHLFDDCSIGDRGSVCAGRVYGVARVVNRVTTE